MENFMVFAGNQYESSGGMDDFDRDFSTLDDAMVYVRERYPIKDYNVQFWVEVYSLTERKKVYSMCNGEERF